ncbi:MAG TPA: CAP domain-containing protein [Terracidiphilus sp.]|jgi:hypothetical protein
MYVYKCVNLLGKYILSIVSVLLVFSPVSAERQTESLPVIQPAAVQLLALANQARAAAGAGPLKWDDALAVAARKHCQRMATEGPIGHQYPGELDLSERAGLAGAHFDLIEENVAIGTTPEQIHDEWMHSNGHRENMLNPEVDRVGIAVIASRGVLYATADYTHGVQKLSQEQAEDHIAGLIRPRGLTILPNPALARLACTMESGVPRTNGGVPPAFVMRWQDSDLSHLPKALVDQLASGHYRDAAVGSCEPKGDAGSFTAYRMAVLLY